VRLKSLAAPVLEPLLTAVMSGQSHRQTSQEPTDAVLPLTSSRKSLDSLAIKLGLENIAHTRNTLEDAKEQSTIFHKMVGFIQNSIMFRIYPVLLVLALSSTYSRQGKFILQNKAEGNGLSIWLIQQAMEYLTHSLQ
jgi:hypothetical protein